MASEDTGGTKGATVESIRLELETNFEKVLKQEAYNFQRFVVKTGVISRNVSNSFNQLGQSVAKSMRHMTEGALKGITKSFDENIKLMKSVSSQGIDVNELYIKTFSRLEKAQEEYREEINKTEQALNGLKEAAKHYKDDDKFGDTQKKANKDVSEQKILELSQKAEALKQKLDREHQKIFDQFNLRLGKMAQEATGAYVQQTETALESVRSSVSKLNRELGKIRKGSGEKDDLVTLFDYQSYFDKVKKQHANLQDALRQQSKLTAEAERKMQDARLAHDNAVSKQTKDKTYEALKKTAINQDIVKKGYIELEEKVRKFGTTVGTVQNEIDTLSQKMKKSLSGKFEFTSHGIFKNIQTSMDLLVQRAQDTGRGMNEAIASNIEKSTKVTGALDLQVEKLKELREQALILHKTGFVDEREQIRKIDAVLKEYNKFFAQYKKEQSIIQNTLGKKNILQASFNFSGIKKFREEYNYLSKEIERNGAITSKNMFEAQDNVKKLESLWQNYVKKRIELNGRIRSLIEEQNRVEQEKATVTNAKLRSLLDDHINRIKTKVAALKGELDKPFNSLKVTAYFNQIKEAALKSQDDIKKKFIDSNKHVEESFQNIKKQYDALIDKATKLSQKRFVSKYTIDETKKGFEDIKKQAQQYARQILLVQNAIRELQQIQKRGLGGPGIQQQIKTLQNQAATMKSHIQSLNVYATQAQRNIEKLHTGYIKTITRNAWESIRNFRWQVAAIIYLFTYAARAVQRTFFDVIEQAQEFRKQSMSIASNVVYKMIGEIETSYQRAYEFSRSLMVKLELEAARTILTLEDMLMLTKTFAQAGIIPKTDEDVRKISTIGTAIKALTEGMANAGVQMRQELYAIIAGRQRATDQLAMMFKMMGVNIQEVIEKSKKEGKSMIDALSEALEPFQQMNKMMETEFETVRNKLKTVWGMIKRIAAEPVLEKIAGELNALIDKFIDLDKKVLTPMGENLVQGVRAGLVVIHEWGKYFLKNLKDIFTVFTTFLSIIHDIGASIGLWKNELDKIDSEALQGILKAAKMVLVTFAFIHRSVDDVLTTINVLIKTVTLGIRSMDNLGKATSAWLFRDKKALKEIGEDQAKIWDQTKEAYKKFWNIITNENDPLKEVDAVIKSITDAINNIDNKPVDLGFTFNLPSNFEDIKSTMQSVLEDYNQMKLDAAEGPIKFQMQYELDLKKYEDTKEELKKAIDYINHVFKSAEEGFVRIPDKQRKMYEEMREGYTQNLQMILDMEDAALKRRDKNTEEYNRKQKEAYAEALKQYNSYIIELRDKPETPKEKTDKWYALAIEEINKLIETNQIAKGKIQELWDALAEGYQNRVQQNVKDAASEYEGFINKIKSHEAVNAIDKIGNEFNDLIKSIKESLKLGDEEKIILEQLANKTKERRIELERTAQAQRMLMQQFELEGKRASFMQKDFMPDDIKKSGRILEVENQYNRSIKSIEHQLQNLHDLWQKQPGIWDNNTEEFQRHADILKQEMQLLKESFKFDSILVKLPFDFKEMERDIENLRTKTTQITKDSLTGPDKFKYEYDEQIKLNEEQAKRFKDQIKAIKKQLSDVSDLSPEQRKYLKNAINNLKDGLKAIEELNKATLDRMKDDTKKWEDEQRKALARQKKEWESYLIEVRNKPETRRQKTDKWIYLQIEKINELKETNIFATAEIQKAWDNLSKGLEDRIRQDIKDTKKEYDDFVSKIKSYETVTELDKIGNEFEEIKESIEQSVNFSPRMKRELKEMAEKARDKRIELEKTAQAQRMIMRMLELENKRASFMQKSFMPDDIRKAGKILEVKNDYTRSIKAIEHELKNLHDRWKEEPGIWRNNTREFQEHAAALKEEMQLLKEAFKFDSFMSKLPYDPDEIKSGLEDLRNKTTQITKESLSGPKKFEYEYTEEIKRNKEQAEEWLAQLKSYRDQMADVPVPNFYSTEQRATFERDIRELEKGLENIEVANKAALDRRNKDLSDWGKEQANILERQKATWEKFLIEIRDRPQTRDQKTRTWLEESTIQLKKYVHEFGKTKEEEQSALNDLMEGYNRRMRQNAEATQSEMEDLINTVSSHEVLSAIEKIELEFEKVQKTLQDNLDIQEMLNSSIDDNNLTEAEKERRRILLEQLRLLSGIINKAKEQRIEEERLNQVYRNRVKFLDVLNAKASYMQGSFSPLERQKGDLLALQTQYSKSMMDIRKEMDITIAESWNKLKGMWETQEAADYFRLLQEEARITNKVFEREFFRKQYPLWTQLNEMSQNWADGLSDSLADLVLDFDNFAESIKSLWESILRDTLKASIKQGLINPLMSSLGTGEPGSPTLFQRMFGKKDEEKANAPVDSKDIASAVQKLQEMMGFGKEGQMSIMDTFLASGTPIPVVVVDGAEQIAGIQAILNRTNESVSKTGADTKGAINNASNQSKTVFQQMLSALFGIKAAIVGSSGSNAAGSTAGSAAGMFGWVAGLFSGGGAGGGAAAGATTLSTGAVINRSGAVWGMAEGGTISEHIVGRGLKSGRIYEFGEKTKYGEFEDVIPRKKMPIHGSSQSVMMSMPININAIDTQTGVDFIMKNQKVIENGMLRSMKNNKALRGMIRQSW